MPTVVIRAVLSSLGHISQQFVVVIALPPIPGPIDNAGTVFQRPRRRKSTARSVVPSWATLRSGRDEITDQLPLS
jgi:hypothetical protein